MTSPTRGTLIALSFVVVPVIVVIASAGVIVLPSIEESRALEEKILAVQAQLELADEAEEALWNFAQDGTTELEVITAWETTHIPAEETDRERYELLRDYATLSGVELI